MNSNLETVTGLLLLLQQNELESIIQTANALINKTEILQNEDAELFYKLLNKSHDFLYPPLSVLKKTSAKIYLNVLRTVDFLNLFLEKIINTHNLKNKKKVKINTRFKIKIYHFFIEIMRAWFLKLEIPNSIKSATGNRQKFPALLERQFPGYISAGLFVDLVLIRGSQY